MPVDLGGGDNESDEGCSRTCMCNYYCGCDMVLLRPKGGYRCCGTCSGGVRAWLVHLGSLGLSSALQAGLSSRLTRSPNFLKLRLLPLCGRSWRPPVPQWYVAMRCGLCVVNDGRVTPVRLVSQQGCVKAVMQYQGKVPEQQMDMIFMQMLQQKLPADQKEVCCCSCRVLCAQTAP